MSTSRKDPSETRSQLARAAEDHALVSVPMEERQGGHRLALSPVSVATALVIFAIAGFTVWLAGFWVGMVAGVLVAAFGMYLGYSLSRLAHETGLSGTITARFFGFGLKGSSIVSGVFIIMILGFLAVESFLLYEGTRLMFNLPDSWGWRIAIYGIQTALWIALAVFGLKLALKASQVLLIVTALVAIYMIIKIYIIDGTNPMTVFNYAGAVPGGFWPKLEAAIGVMGATAGTIALVTADFARYARTRTDVAILSAAGPITQNIIMTVIGSLIVIGGMPTVVQYILDRNAGMSAMEAEAAGSAFVMTNTGAFFVIFAAWAGFITIYAAQAKAQAINAYSGSLALVNFVNSLTGRKPPRVWMVVLGNAIALGMIAIGIVRQFDTYLAYLGTITLAMTAVMITDFYVVRRQHFDASTHNVEQWNWAGVITVHIAAITGIVLIATKVFPLGFLVSFVLALGIYPVLRALMPEGTGTSFVSKEEVLDEAV